MLGFVLTHAQTSLLLPQTVRAHHVRVLLKHGGCNILLGSRSGRMTSHAKLETPDIATLLSRRQLQRAGHVLRMGEERLPHSMLTSWIPTAQPKGRPQLTFAQGLVKDLTYAGLNSPIGECSLQTGGPGERPSTTLVLMKRNS